MYKPLSPNDPNSLYGSLSSYKPLCQNLNTKNRIRDSYHEPVQCFPFFLPFLFFFFFGCCAVPLPLPLPVLLASPSVEPSSFL
jgi:hypothetical protein